VPAPATTNMGPWTCSMASLWRSSGMNGAGRVNFWDGIVAQDITWEDEEPCAKRVLVGTTESAAQAKLERGSRLDRVLRQLGQPLRAVPAWLVLLPCVWIHLENSEGVAFGIHEISLPAGFGYCEFRESDDSTRVGNCFRRRIKILDFQRADERVRA